MEDNTHDTRGLTPEMVANKWQPGFCPNPKGRPKGARNRQSIYKQWLEVDPNGDGKENADMIAIAMIEKAKAGDVGAAKEVFDSGYGKQAESFAVDHTSKGESITPATSRLADFLLRKKSDAGEA